MRRSTLAAILFAALLATPAASFAGDYTPDYARIRSGLERTASIRSAPVPASTALRQSTQNARVTSGQRDSIWNGLLIGAGIGAVGGYVWARNECGSNDAECSAITNPVGILVGAGIGAAVGGILDAFSR